MEAGGRPAFEGFEGSAGKGQHRNGIGQAGQAILGGLHYPGQIWSPGGATSQNLPEEQGSVLLVAVLVAEGQ